MSGVCRRLAMAPVALALSVTLALPAITQAAVPQRNHLASPALSLHCGARSCARTMIALLNMDRARAGIRPLRLTAMQSTGNGACTGSYGHSTAMAASGAIWHSNTRFPRASFPRNLCVSFTHAGENVGVATTGTIATDLHTLERMMMSEPHGASTCATEVNHACTILDGAYGHVGIGIYEANGSTWLTEDFVN